MSTGDTNDFVGRLYQLLPNHWFPDLAEAPILNAVLTGLATTWAWTYSQLRYAQMQTRLGTATEEWLDLIALDYIGDNLRRNPGETDTAYRGRIQQEILRTRGTRPALSNILTSLTGTPPFIFEPRNPQDTGGYNVPQSLAYGLVGGYGDMNLPFQLFALVNLPEVSPVTVGSLAGWTIPIGGYGIGAVEYASAAMFAQALTAVNVLTAIEDVKPASVIVWVATGENLPTIGSVVGVRFDVVGQNIIGSLAI